MARPAKAVNVQTKNPTAAEREAREFVENALKGRDGPLTLHNAFRWSGRHCFLTDIKDIDRMYLMEITLGVSNVVDVDGKRYAVRVCHTLDEYGIARREEP